MELYVSVGAVSQEAINAGDFQVVVSPAAGNQPAGCSFGRFYDILGEQAVDLMQRIAHEEERLSPQRLFAELVYLPPHASSGNVTTRPVSRRFEIVVGVTAGVGHSNTIPLTDLVVGMRHNLFYLRSISREVEVVVRSSHRFNHHIASNVFRFLSEVSTEGVLCPQRFDWGAAARLNFLPRLRVGRIVLCPARWLLSRESIECQRHEDGPEWSAAVRRWLQVWDVPRYVYLAEFDNRLLLDLNNPRDLMYLERQYRQRVPQGQALELQEVLPALNQAWATDEDGRRYLLEFVVPLRRRRSETEWAAGVQRGTVRSTFSRPPRHVHLLARMRPPGTEWLFAKLYCADDVHDDLIVDYLPALTDEFFERGLTDLWFFIRYADPEPHLRLRFFGNPKLLSEYILPRLAEWSSALVAARIAQRLVLDTYDRELERYGGVEAMAIAERIFAADSIATIQILNLQRRGLDLPKSDLALLSVDALLASVGLTRTERLGVYTTIVAQQEDAQRNELPRLRKEFFGYRKAAQRIVADGEWLQNQPRGDALASVLHCRTEQISPLGDQLHVLEARGELSVGITSIVESLIHMHLNRMFGVDRQLEYETIYYLMRALQSLERLQAAAPHVFHFKVEGGT